MMCACKTLPGGDKVICDACASRMIEMLNDVVPEQAEGLLLVLTKDEYIGMMSAVNLWTKTLESKGGTHAW